MADVDSTLRLWSATAASNKPTGSTSIGTNLDDNIREVEAVVRRYLASPGSDMASASTVDLSTANGFYVTVTGTTSITSLGTESSGIYYLLKFAAALTLTHNATSLILPGGANITTAAGDLALMISEGSGNWRCVYYTRASGEPSAAFVDTNPIVVGSADATKKLRLEVDGFTTATTRVLTPPNFDGTIATLAGTETLTNKTLTAPAVNGALSGDAIAAQAEMETATATDSIVSPGRQHFHPGHPKCWAYVTVSGGTPTLQTSYNISSITDTATGQLGITFATAFSSANWASIAMLGQVGTFTNVTPLAVSKVAGSVVINCADGSAFVDPPEWNFMGLGDLA